MWRPASWRHDRARARLAPRHGRSRSLAVEGSGGLLAAAVGPAAGSISHNLPEQLRFTANGLLLDGGSWWWKGPARSAPLPGDGAADRRAGLGRDEGLAGAVSASTCVSRGGVMGAEAGIGASAAMASRWSSC